MDLDRLHDSWDQLGKTDARWAILSQAGREGGKWDDAAFWQSGVAFVQQVAQHLIGLDLVPARQRALDFGCGQGRLTQALANYFDEVVGVDIAASMLDVARTANRHGDRVSYVHNVRADLSGFPDASFDCVMSVLVLQHMRPDYAAGYLREFVRLLRPGGCAFFQIPLEPLAPPPAANRVSTHSERLRPASSLVAQTTLLQPRVALQESSWRWLRVEVRNCGADTMHALGAGCVEVGARFLGPDDMVVAPASWTSLPCDLAPGESVSFLLFVRAPAVAGAYALVALPCVRRLWCEHSGNVAAACRMVVSKQPIGRLAADVPPPRPQVPGVRPAGGLIEVHGTSIGQLEANITAAGGELRDVALDAWAGYEYVSAHCVVRKP